MLYDRGPLDLLPDTAFPQLIVRQDFTALASIEVAALESHALSLDSSASAIASALGSSTQGLEGLELAEASQELAHQPSDLDASAGGLAANADVLERELGGLMGELPDPNVGMPVPPEPPTETPGVPPPGPPYPIPPTYETYGAGSSPAPSSSPAPGSSQGPTYDGSDAARALQAYADRNPNERGRIDAFIRANPGDYSRAPGALGLPGWMEFYDRWLRGAL